MDVVFKELFDIEPQVDYPDERTQEKMNTINGAYKIHIEQTEDLSNGDKVILTVSVNEEETKHVKGRERKDTVGDLEVPEQLASSEVENNLVIDFLGASGRGYARVESKFSDELSHINFKVKNNGLLENGEQVKCLTLFIKRFYLSLF